MSRALNSKVENILLKHRQLKIKIKNLELDKELYSNNPKKLKEIEEKMQFYEKINLKMDKCLQSLNKNELKFIEEHLFNGKTYFQIKDLLDILNSSVKNLSNQAILVKNKIYLKLVNNMIEEFLWEVLLEC